MPATLEMPLAVFHTGTFAGETSSKHRNAPPRIFGHACREAKDNVNIRLLNYIQTLYYC